MTPVGFLKQKKIVSLAFNAVHIWYGAYYFHDVWRSYYLSLGLLYGSTEICNLPELHDV